MAASSASACSGERTLCAQLCTVVTPALSASASAEPHAAIAVFGRHEPAEPVADREISDRGNVGAHERPEQAGPQVPVRVDEARHADHAAAVDDLRLRRIDLGRDRDDRAVAHMHVAGREIGDLRVHGQHGGAADDELAARRQRRARALGGARGRRWARSSCGVASSAPSAVAPLSIVRRLIGCCVIVVPPVSILSVVGVSIVRTRAV